MAYGGMNEMNDDVIDHVTSSGKVKVVTPISLRPIFPKRLEIETPLQWGTYKKWHVRYRMVTCNSLTQIEWVADFSLGNEDGKYSERKIRKSAS